MENSKTYRFEDDGSRVTATNATELVTKMRDSSRFAFEQDIASFMAGFSERYGIQSGQIVRFDNAENFVEDLLKFGFLKKTLLRLNEGDKVYFTDSRTKAQYATMFKTEEFIIKKIMNHAQRKNGIGYRIETLKGEYVVNTSSDQIERL